MIKLFAETEETKTDEMIHSGSSLLIRLGHRCQSFGLRTQSCFSLMYATNQCNLRHRPSSWAFSRPFSSTMHNYGQYLTGEKDRFNARIVNLADAGNQDFTSDVGQFGTILAGKCAVFSPDGGTFFG